MTDFPALYPRAVTTEDMKLELDKPMFVPFRRFDHLVLKYPDIQFKELALTVGATHGMTLRQTEQHYETHLAEYQARPLPLIDDIEVSDPDESSTGGDGLDKPKPKPKAKPKKSRLQSAGTRAKPVKKWKQKDEVEAEPSSPAAQSSATETTQKIVFTPSQLSSVGSEVQCIQPGLVLMRGILGPKTQKWLVRMTFLAGGNPDGYGFYKSETTKTGEPVLVTKTKGVFKEQLRCFPRHFTDIALNLFKQSQDACPALAAHPYPYNPSMCLFNLYSRNGGKLGWHSDSLEKNGFQAAPDGSPVVSISLGDRGEFQYKDPAGSVVSLVLESGDVIVFGGPSRFVPHAVSRIFPHTCPAWLHMPHAGRLNLTYREWAGCA
eukprot:TRINITY_DN77866_c0_g1_i1.p1 TRINITY_DN77866_c0_g1~~TRINITY_DN77866_c0_g1_i1.p1  ORF type:complete len:377 (+),score=28.11 TRINITY_DN77866_c0_g1_i1:50-1180(+)